MLQSNESQPLDMDVQKHIADCLLPYLETLPNLPATLKYGVLHKSTKSMCVQFKESFQISDQGILGDYEGKFHFTIAYRFDENEADTELYGLKTIYKINEYFNIATSNQTLPDLGDRMKCLSIMLATLPVTEKNTDGMLDCKAVFALTMKLK